MEENFNEQETESSEVTQQAREAKPAKGISGRFFLGLLIGILISNLFVLVLMHYKGKGNFYLLNGTVSKKNTVLTSEVKDKIRLIESSIDQNYLKEVSDEDLANGLFKGMVDATGDKYAEYYTKEEMQKVQESATGIFYGIGAYVGIDADTGYPKLTGIMEDTPAEAAVLKADDVVIEVDGEDVRNWELSDVVAKIKGDKGTQVELTIYRNGETDYLKIKVTRDEVKSPTVTLEMQDDGVAYMVIRQFEQVTIEQFAEKLKEARDANMKGLILDLRGNPGGTLDSVVQIARQILPEGLIVYTEDKYGQRNEFKCDGKHQLDVPMVVLVNENTASAAEILSGAVKDYGIGTLVGKTTYGKGIVQKVFSINDGSAVKLTISHYYTPKGNDIHEVGVEPDVECELDVDKYLDEEIDTQYEKALSILKDKMKKGDGQ